MNSQWFILKERAISLRKKGFSIKYVEKKLGINRSTLSGWFKAIELTQAQRDQLLLNWKNGLAIAQKKGGQWHADQGEKRRAAIRKEVEIFTSNIHIDKTIGELILATFYLAEGTKRENCFRVANSNSEVLKGFISLLRYLYEIDESKLRCVLHLRKDQNEAELKKYWSDLLKIPLEKFLKTQFDKRTVRETYHHYKGVCIVNYYDMALQRRVLYLGEKILGIIKNTGG